MPKYFNCTSEGLNPQMFELINKLEKKLNANLIITSAFRSVEHERNKKRSGLSAHCKGLAVDIACSESNFRFRLIQTALSIGFNRIGISKTFIHLDIADFSHGKTPETIWLYD